MKLLINAGHLKGSGVVQVSLSFIHETLNYRDVESLVLISPTIDGQIDKSKFPSNYKFVVIQQHPFFSISAPAIQLRLRKLEKSFGPDVVFSVFGPSYWTPKSPHVMGFAYPHIVYRDSPFFGTLSWLERRKIFLINYIRLYFLDRNGKNYVSETGDVSERLSRVLGKKKNYFVVGNTFSQLYETNAYSKGKEVFNKRASSKEFLFLSLCTYMPHKNLAILNKVIPLLNSYQINYKFILTIDDDEMHNFTEVAKKNIINLGRLKAEECPQIYREVDAVFLPTLLECFSANYPEAMKMEKPILTSRLTFAVDICKNAALYFDPLDPVEIASQLLRVYSSSSLREDLIFRGREVLKNFNRPDNRAQNYMNICYELAGRKI